MSFNNFLLVSNDEVQILQNNINQVAIKTRKELIKNVYISAEKCRSILYDQNTKLNKKIQTSINETNKCLNLIVENLKSIFTIKQTKTQIEDFNLFEFLKQLLNCIDEIFNWTINENKDYYKSIAIKSANNLIECFNKILSSLKDSNIRLFKFM